MDRILSRPLHHWRSFASAEIWYNFNFVLFGHGLAVIASGVGAVPAEPVAVGPRGE